MCKDVIVICCRCHSFLHDNWVPLLLLPLSLSISLSIRWYISEQERSKHNNHHCDNNILLFMFWNMSLLYYLWLSFILSCWKNIDLIIIFTFKVNLFLRQNSSLVQQKYTISLTKNRTWLCKMTQMFHLLTGYFLVRVIYCFRN